MVATAYLLGVSTRRDQLLKSRVSAMAKHLIAVGVNADRHREILGLDVAAAEERPS